MISLVRYGFVGYREVSILISFLALLAITAAITAWNFRMFDRGSRLRA